MPVLHRGEPHVLYIVRDMTRAARASARCATARSSTAAIFNASADGLVVRDAGDRVVE